MKLQNIWVTIFALATVGIAVPHQQYDIVNASVLLPHDLMYIVSSRRVKAVLEMARENVKELLPGVELFFQFYDDGCKGDKSLKTALEVFDTKHHKCHVLFGPTCEFSVATVGRLLKFFDVPLLTTGAFTWDFTTRKTRRDDEFYGVVRVGPMDFLSIAHFINDINAQFNWTRIMLLYERHGQKEVSGESTCKLMMESLVQSFTNHSDKIEYRASDLDRLNDTHKVLLEEVGVDYAGSFSL